MSTGDAPKRRGRPRAEPSTQISTRLRTPLADRLIQLARDQDQTIAATVRQLLILRLPAAKKDGG